MKLRNCTDKKTDKQSQYGLVEQGVAVDGELLLPGKAVEVADTDKARVEAEHAHLFEVGVLAWEEKLPNAVVKLPAQEEPTPEPEAEEAVKEDKKKGR